VVHLFTPDAGEPAGTRFARQRTRLSSFKLWLKYAKPSQGTVTVDDGRRADAARGRTRLLPVGIVAVDGTFDAGDAIQVRDARPPIGKGICSYSAEGGGR
jgi:glutamate 5-kinase